jgi:L-ascorbate metabolism protein UlaG (beta-lactamase superfamily)
MRATLVGHATFLLQVGGLSILTDPVWSDRASPFSAVGPRRHNPPGIAFDDLPRIDAVLISHNHYDHLDLPTLGRLWLRDRPLILAPLGNDAIIRAENSGIVVTTLDWGGKVTIGGLTVTAVPAQHWSARGLTDRNHALWAGFVVTGGGRTIYFAGDTGFGSGRHFRAIAARHRRIDLALLPIGAYEPRWFMAAQHMNPDDAVQAMRLLGARQALGYHWGTFQLTDEAVDQPTRDLAEALAKRQIFADRFLAMRPGEVWQG